MSLYFIFSGLSTSAVTANGVILDTLCAYSSFVNLLRVSLSELHFAQRDTHKRYERRCDLMTLASLVMIV